jgi:hypothetical protein
MTNDAANDILVHTHISDEDGRVRRQQYLCLYNTFIQVYITPPHRWAVDDDMLFYSPRSLDDVVCGARRWQADAHKRGTNKPSTTQSSAAVKCALTRVGVNS